MNTKLAICLSFLLLFIGTGSFAEKRRSAYVDLSGSNYSVESALNYTLSHYNLPTGSSLRLLNSATDEQGVRHDRYIQTYKGNDVKNAMWILHSRNGLVSFMNGMLISEFEQAMTSASESQALAAALQFTAAKQYKWQIPAQEAWLKKKQKAADATWYPKGKLVWVSPDKMNGAAFVLCYEFDIYAQVPLSRKYVYVQAGSSKIIATEDRIQDFVNNKAVTVTTGYSGSRGIVTDSVGPNDYELHDDSRGALISTYNMQATTFNVDEFYNTNNTWNMVNAAHDQYALDAHWGAEMTYDYYKQKHLRNSIDGAGMDIDGAVHYDTSLFNAFWDGQAAYYGDGTGHPLTAIDIVGHEFSHGVTQHTSGLQYSDESGALNESFSDCMGKAVQYFARPGNFNWRNSTDISPAFRDMSNPNIFNHPKYYLGNFWYTGQGDNGGVHTNSGVMNYWFYMLCDGKKANNERGIPFNVPAIGIEKAAKIIYYTQAYLNTPFTEYRDMAINSTLAAKTLYGDCSKAYDAVIRAWYAVGLSDTSALKKPMAEGVWNADISEFTFSFTNSSYKASSCLWIFGDGKTSTLPNPTHNYPFSFGKPGGLVEDTVKLVATSINGCSDTALIPISFAWPNAVGISKVNNYLSLSIFPNPADNSFSIDINISAGIAASIDAYDITGKLVAPIYKGQLKAGKQTLTVPCTHYANGVYWITCHTDQGNITRKIMVQH